MTPNPTILQTALFLVGVASFTLACVLTLARARRGERQAGRRYPR